MAADDAEIMTVRRSSWSVVTTFATGVLLLVPATTVLPPNPLSLLAGPLFFLIGIEYLVRPYFEYHPTTRTLVVKALAKPFDRRFGGTATSGRSWRTARSCA